MHRSCGIDIVRPQHLQQLVYISYTTIQYANYTYIYIYIHTCVCVCACVCVHPPPGKKKKKHLPDLTVGSSFLLFPMVGPVAFCSHPFVAQT